MSPESKEPVSGERIYVIPLRREWLKVPRNRRGKKAVDAVRDFLSKHMHSDDINISKKLNEIIWKSGIKKPVSRVKVKVSVKDGVVTARLPEEMEIKKEEKKGRLEGLKERAKGAGSAVSGASEYRKSKYAEARKKYVNGKGSEEKETTEEQVKQ